ncbi:deleted in malignant brain tumors 1 protein [Heteronotia binoei]|uniref:deleted in malignant brain tumors 1 protein n=1 Tax=Heteronotia binoei TaxID=13085 RepID=UPI00292CB21A|nr:deleted in malignant brain tumors 1 protein [Heteronotia binoei]
MVFLLEADVKKASGTLASPSLIRLADGNTNCEGRVEVYHNGSWGTVCDDFWDILDAQVVCRQLNCGEANSSHGGAWFGRGNGSIILDNVGCQGNEIALQNCSHNGWGVHDCQHKEDAGVSCSGTLASPSLIRLADGNTNCEGRVEVYHNGSWGTVCDDFWDILDAQVVCRQLNCGEANSSHEGAWFGRGNGSIILDNVGCQGNEIALQNCSHNGWGVHDCQHKEDAGVSCSGDQTLAYQQMFRDAVNIEKRRIDDFSH